MTASATAARAVDLGRRAEPLEERCGDLEDDLREIALGQAGVAKMMQTTTGLVTRVDRYISRFVPVLSFRAGKTTSN